MNLSERVQANFSASIETKIAAADSLTEVIAKASEIGDVKVDVQPQVSEAVQADMLKLPFRNETFDTVVCDPPWAIGIDKRWAVTYRLRDVLKTGGKLLFNGRWIPRIKGLTIEDVFISCGWDCMMDVAIWTTYRKHQSSLDSVLQEADKTSEF